MEFAKLDDVKQRLALAPTDTASDATLMAGLKYFSERFNRHCNRRFEYAAGTMEEFRADSLCLLLERYPVLSITKWELRYSEADVWQEVLAPRYTLQPGGVVELAWALGTVYGRMRVGYEGGYKLPGTVVAGLPELPQDIQGAMIEQVAWWFQTKGSVGADRTWPAQGSYVNFPDISLLPQVKAALAPYIRRLLC